MTVLVRDATRLDPCAVGRVTVVDGDALDTDAVTRTVQGQDAVVVVLGTRNDLSEFFHCIKQKFVSEIRSFCFEEYI